MPICSNHHAWSGLSARQQKKQLLKCLFTDTWTQFKSHCYNSTCNNSIREWLLAWPQSYMVAGTPDGWEKHAHPRNSYMVVDCGQELSVWRLFNHVARHHFFTDISSRCVSARSPSRTVIIIFSDSRKKSALSYSPDSLSLGTEREKRRSRQFWPTKNLKKFRICWMYRSMWNYVGTK